MKTILLLALTLTALLQGCKVAEGSGLFLGSPGDANKAVSLEANHRLQQTINREWTFNYFPAESADTAGCQAPGFDDSTWPAVAVPHTWQTYETTGKVHPSIFFWSMGNETDDAVDSKLALEEDTTRIIHARDIYNDSSGKFVATTSNNIALESLLRCTIRGWYNQDVRDLEPASAQQAGHETWQHDLNAQEIIKRNQGRSPDDRANLNTWLYEDHGCDREYANAPLKHVNPKGFVDSWRTPKYFYYLWQAVYAEKPMVFIHPHFWRSQYLGQKKEIAVDSNCDTVELKVNGHGGDKYSWYSWYTAVLYTRGECAVLTYDQAGEGERNKDHKSGSRAHDRIEGDAVLARHLAGLMITDVRQAVSYLSQRPDVDDRRIAAGGYSLGSFVLALAGAVEPRLRACVMVGGGNLDGPNGRWDNSSKSMCESQPYRSLDFLGDRPVVQWLEQQIDFPNWTEETIRSMPETKISLWAEKNGVAMDRLYATEEREGGTMALGSDIPAYTRETLDVFPPEEWESKKNDLILETWVEAAIRDASRHEAATGAAVPASPP